MFDEVYEKYYSKIEQRRRQNILELMHLAVNLNNRDLFYHWAEEYNKLFGGL